MSDFKVHSPETSPSESKSLLEGVKGAMSFVPNLMGVMAESKAVLSSYLALSDFFSKTSFSPIEQQVVLLSVSKENECGYCLAAHSMLARNIAKMDSDSIEKIKMGATLADPKLNALGAFTKNIVSSRGNPSEQDLSAFFSQGYTQKHVLEVMLGVAMKTLSNYVNHVAKTPVDEVFLK
ncbi:MAG: carboxymuconolactone decarboxylase family protein [Bacteriovoracia bacterium]